jgi:alpha-glucosidase
MKKKMQLNWIQIGAGALLALSLCACPGKPDAVRLSSPNGTIDVHVSTANRSLTYSGGKDGKPVILPSQLGFELGGKPFAGPFAIRKITPSACDETWEQPWGEEITVRNHYNEARIELQETEGDRRRLTLVFRAFDDGIGFRYEFPAQPHLSDLEITAERTEFVFPADFQAWSIPAYRGEYYEMLYQKTPLSLLDTVSTPLTIETDDGGYIALHEANLTDYATMNLYPAPGNRLKTDLTPWSTGVKVYAQTPHVSPWRTIILASDLNRLVNSRIMLNLNEPSLLPDTSWLHPTKYVGIWWGMHKEKYTWSQGPKHGATTQNMMEYIDFAAAHHIPAVLVEGWNYGWDGDWVANGHQFSFTKPYPDFDIEAIVRYAAAKGVEIIGHNETGGSTINYENQLDSAFAFLTRYGIYSVKTGYVNHLLDKKERHSSQYGVRHYRKVIETAARYHIMIDNHEPVMPTGLQRTYPNIMTQEGVRGQEYDAWSSDGGSPPEHTTILPFTRGLAGPMDFTFGTFDFTNPVYPQTRVQTTLAKQLALYVVLYSPLQMASDLPENYAKHPSAFEWIEIVPTDWAKSIVLDGKIGDYVITARKDKHSADWFLGAITDENARTLPLDFSFLDPGKTYLARIFRDTESSHWKTNPYPLIVEEKEVDHQSLWHIPLAPGGGAAIWIREGGR